MGPYFFEIKRKKQTTNHNDMKDREEKPWYKSKAIWAAILLGILGIIHYIKTSNLTESA